jgi:hypothetical protein
MELKDADYLEYSTYDYVDYSKPKVSWITGELLDDTKVVAEEWLLKPQFIPAIVSSIDGYPNNDLSYNRRSVVVIGTELQIYNKFCEMIEKYGWQQQDSWDRELKPSWRIHYKNNSKQPTVINLI